jgi:hypothetical protein
MAATVSIRLTLEGEQIWDRALAGLESRIADAGPAWPQVLTAFRAIAKAAMDSEGASTDAGAWPQLAPSTQRQRARKGFGAAHPILERTGRLRRAVMLESDSTVTQSPKQLMIAIDLDYFRFHQSRRPRLKLPRRAPISFTQDQRYQLIHPLRLWFTGHDPDARINT